MKKLFIALFVLLFVVSCSWFEGQMTKVELELELTQDDHYDYVYNGDLTPEDGVDYILTLTVASGSELQLGENCLGAFAGHASEVIVSSAFNTAIYGAFTSDSALKTLRFQSTATPAEGSLCGCSASVAVYVNGSLVDNTSLIAQE